MGQQWFSSGLRLGMGMGMKKKNKKGINIIKQK
jgi:hypothetical protein